MNKNNKAEELLRKLLEELHDIEDTNNQESIYDEELAFELENLTKGVRTRPVFYD
jgi:hypothetical protein